MTGPMRHGTNSWWPSSSASVRSPDATRSSFSKISRPTCSTVASPSAIRPALMSIFSVIRRYVVELLAIFNTGIVGKPMALPRPVVNAIRFTPPAAKPVTVAQAFVPLPKPPQPAAPQNTPTPKPRPVMLASYQPPKPKTFPRRETGEGDIGDDAMSSKLKAHDWTIQIGAYADKALADAQLRNYAEKAQDVLARASRIIAPLQSSSGHTIYRARFGLFAEQEARDVCNRLTQRGQTCFAAVQTR